MERPGQRLLDASSLAHLVERQVVNDPECVAVDDPDPVTICIAGWLGRPDRLAAQIANCVPATYWWGRLRRVESWAPPEAEGVVPDARISVSEPGPGSGP